MRILIVEDDLLSRRILSKYLTPYGECEIAVNGIEAVEAYDRALADNSTYGLICLDIMMPEIDGQEVLKIIREKEKKAEIPPGKEMKIIMTTALQTPRDVFEAFYHGGCTAYLAKPIENKILIKQLKELGIAKSKTSRS